MTHDLIKQIAEDELPVLFRTIHEDPLLHGARDLLVSGACYERVCRQTAGNTSRRGMLLRRRLSRLISCRNSPIAELPKGHPRRMLTNIYREAYIQSSNSSIMHYDTRYLVCSSCPKPALATVVGCRGCRICRSQQHDINSKNWDPLSLWPALVQSTK